LPTPLCKLENQAENGEGQHQQHMAAQDNRNGRVHTAARSPGLRF
jgi:hypothetical protein